jgi:SWI/SNF-related matrix-associated actin-dependent regulator of chromatin subfamily A member 5
LDKVGYGEWDALKEAIRTSPFLRCNWYLKSRTPLELHRRCDTLIRMLMNEEEKDKKKKIDLKKPKRDDKEVSCLVSVSFFSEKQ